MDNLTTTISPLVIDLIIAVIILLVACLKAKAGLYQSVMSIVVIILAVAIGLVGAKLLEKPVSDYAWSKYSVTVEEKFDAEVEAALSGERSLSKVFQDSWNRLIQSFGVEQLDGLMIKDTDDVDYQDNEMVAKLKILALSKSKLLCDKVCHLALFGIITAIALLVLTIIKNLLGKVADFSIIGWVNHGGGFVLGAIESIVIILVVVRGAGLLNIPTFRNLSEGTVLMKWFVGGDVQSTITKLQDITIEDIKNIKLEDLTTVDFDQVGEDLKDIIKNIDMTKVPEQITDAVDKIDKEEIKGVTDAVKDVVDGVVDDVKKEVDKVKK